MITQSATTISAAMTASESLIRAPSYPPRTTGGPMLSASISALAIAMYIGTTMNGALISQLTDLRQRAALTNQYAARAYDRVLAALAEWPHRANEEGLSALCAHLRSRGVGTSIMKKVTEHVRTGAIAEATQARAYLRAHGALSRVKGAGPRTVERWIAQGADSVTALRARVRSGHIALTRAQALGLRYYSDLNKRIPRAEVEAIGRIVSAYISPCTLAGSYRRGALDSGDVDILTTGSDLAALARALEADPRFVAVLSAGPERLSFLYRGPSTKAGPGNGPKPAPVRQVDVLNVAPARHGAALLYLTGSGPFNERMRGIAKSRGLRLNQHGLYKRAPDGSLLPVSTHTERDIFAALGMAYIAPAQRT